MKMNKPKSAAFNRRQMLLAGAIAGGASFVGPRRALAASSLPVRGSGPEIYSRFGVKPFINCTSTYTINGGSAMLPEVDRKSTRLNSSHGYISYAVFCLKKKKHY